VKKIADGQTHIKNDPRSSKYSSSYSNKRGFENIILNTSGIVVFKLVNVVNVLSLVGFISRSSPSLVFSSLHKYYFPYAHPSSLSMTALNASKGCGPSIFCGFEPSLFATIKEGVSANPRECAKAISFSINDLYF
jgi:hypothetical protein